MGNASIPGKEQNSAENSLNEESIHSGEMKKFFQGKLYKIMHVVPEIEIKKIQYKKRKDSERKKLRKEFNKTVRAEFCKSLVEDEKSVELLKSLGVKPAEIKAMKGKGLVPSGFQVHHKLPLHDGGDNNFENLVLIKNHPYHKMITNYQNEKCRDMKENEVKELDFPCGITGSIYPSKSETDPELKEIVEKFDKNKKNSGGRKKMEKQQLHDN